MSSAHDLPEDCHRLTDEEMRQRVSRAIDELVRSGITPSFYSVASLAHVARSTLYRKPSLRRLVEGARSDAARLQPSWRMALKQLEGENAALKGRVVQLEDALAQLSREADKRPRAKNAPTCEYAVIRLEVRNRAA